MHYSARILINVACAALVLTSTVANSSKYEKSEHVEIAKSADNDDFEDDKENRAEAEDTHENKYKLKKFKKSSRLKEDDYYGSDENRHKDNGKKGKGHYEHGNGNGRYKNKYGCEKDNSEPVANSLTVTTSEDASIAIDLTGTERL